MGSETISGKFNTILSLTFIFMAVGTTIELALIGHYEGNWQLLPLIVLLLGFVFFLINKARKSPLVNNIFQLIMVVSVLSGFLGIWFHLKANYEFEFELHPSYSFMENVLESLSGALPVLAPGSMIVFGLIGHLFNLINKKL